MSSARQRVESPAVRRRTPRRSPVVTTAGLDRDARREVDGAAGTESEHHHTGIFFGCTPPLVAVADVTRSTPALPAVALVERVPAGRQCAHLELLVQQIAQLRHDERAE